MARRNVLAQVASLGEEALGRIANNAAATRMLQGAVELKDRVDDLGKRVRGLEDMEKRLDRIEKRLEKLEQPAPKTSASSPKAGTKKTTTTKSSGAS